MGIYFDNAATTMQKPDSVPEAVMRAMKSFGNSGRGAHDEAMDAARIIYETREMIAKLFNAGDPKQTVFTANSTESLNMVIQGLIEPGDHVITTVLEHNSVLRPLYQLEKGDVNISFLTCDQLGVLRYGELESLLTPRTKAIVCTHASNVTGNSVDLERIGAFCRKFRLMFIVDASQSAGVLPVDMKKMNIDVLCFTGHKGLYGPQGTGGLCVREGLSIKPLKTGGSGIRTYDKEHPKDMPTALEAGTLNGHGIAGLHAALTFLMETGIENIHKREIMLMRQFYDGIRDIAGIHVYGDFINDNRAAIVALNIRSYDSSEVSDELAYSYGISTRPGAHCAPLFHQEMGTKDQGMVRFSFSWFNTEEEVEAGIMAVKEMAEEMSDDM